MCTGQSSEQLSKQGIFEKYQIYMSISDYIHVENKDFRLLTPLCYVRWNLCLCWANDCRTTGRDAGPGTTATVWCAVTKHFSMPSLRKSLKKLQLTERLFPASRHLSLPAGGDRRATHPRRVQPTVKYSRWQLVASYIRMVDVKTLFSYLAEDS